MKCARCGKETNVFKMSMFNTDKCCLDCIEKEKQHPMYAKAVEVEMEQVKAGNYNFDGIGKPENL